MSDEKLDRIAESYGSFGQDDDQDEDHADDESPTSPETVDDDDQDQDSSTSEPLAPDVRPTPNVAPTRSSAADVPAWLVAAHPDESTQADPVLLAAWRRRHPDWQPAVEVA